MQLYSGTTTEFLEHDAQRSIVEKLKISFLEYYQHMPSESEQGSWKHSLRALATQIKRTSLTDHGIILEMQLPLTSKRLDALLTGISREGKASSVLLELKQWTDAASADEDECVQVAFGRSPKVVLHPSFQAKYYADYLKDYRSVFYEEPAVDLWPCSWLHNFQTDPDSTLLDRNKFGDVLNDVPLFGGSDAESLTHFLLEHLGNGGGRPVLDRVLNSRFAPSKKLMEHTASVIRGNRDYVLLDEQRVAFDRIIHAAKRASNRNGQRSVILINGGPGTGKSVIALNVMAELLSMGKNVQHATGSKAFTENLRRALGSKAGSQFRYFNSFVDADDGAIDVLICDEAHRIRESSNNRYTQAGKRSALPQVDELMRSSKVSVFFIDDKQVVRPGEVGSSELITDAAKSMNAKVVRQDLIAQFRCGGSDEYIDWVDNLLGIRATSQDKLDLEMPFKFEIVASPHDLETNIRNQIAAGNAARLTAGFCWKWSKPKDGSLVDDVVIGTYRRPWNAQPDATKLPKGVPKSNFWATDPAGVDQVGCVYTAQGFEFDYVGVIWGPDLVWRAEEGGWTGVRGASHDGVVKRSTDEHFTDLVKNTYRVLMTRGMKGCYLYVIDEETREHIANSLIRK